MRFSREQYLDLMTFGAAGRPMFAELFGPLIGLEEEWRAQGARQDEIDLTAFDWDYVDTVHCGANTDVIQRFTPAVLDENDEYILRRDHLGRKTKLYKGFATIALPVDYPVCDMTSWLRIKHMFAYDDCRINRTQLEVAKKARQNGSLVIAGIPGGFDLPRQLMGEENACLCYYDQPELMADIIQTVSDTAYRVLEQVSRELVIDQLSVHEDLAGKSGPLVGPRHIAEFIQPYYLRSWTLLADRGTCIFQQDSDGRVGPVIDAFLDCGLTCMFPMEPAAGMDVVAVRKTYGKKLAMLGGIDKHVLRQSKEAIRRELEYKMQPSMRTGGMVFGLDHRTPMVHLWTTIDIT